MQYRQGKLKLPLTKCNDDHKTLSIRSVHSETEHMYKTAMLAYNDIDHIGETKFVTYKMIPDYKSERSWN